MTDNPPVRTYVNKIENRITFRIKTGYYLQLLTPETMKLIGSTKSKMTKDENGENLSRLEITEVVYPISIVIFSTKIINKIQEYYLHSFLMDISVDYQIFHPKILFFKKTFNSEFSFIEVWFTDQNSKPLEIEDNKHYFSY